MTRDPVRLRDAGTRDAGEILRHRRRMFEDMGYRDPEALAAMELGSEPFIARGLADGSLRAWLVEDAEGHVVAGGGVAVTPWPAHPREPQPRRATIVNLFTEPAWRRRGLARRLMAAMIDWCRREGFRSVSLHASDDGRRLYDALGFVPTNEMRLRL